MINIASKEKPELKIVDSIRPEDNYLLRKIAGKGIAGGHMPLGDAPLSGDDEQTIRAWVMSLRPDPPPVSEAAPDQAPTRPAFWGSRLINLPTTRMVGHRHLQFLVAHSFYPSLSSGYDALFGLNGPAAVLINFTYGLSDRLQVMLGHTNSENQFDLAGRWLLLPGRKGSNRPLALALQAGAGLATQKIPGEDRFAAAHFKINLQTALSYQFCPHLSLLLVPSYSTHVNHHDANPESVLALGTGVKFTIFKELALIGQWLPVLDGPRAAANGWGGGLEYKVGGHVFQVFFLNSVGLLADQYLPGGDLLLKKGDFRFVFNLFRDF